MDITSEEIAFVEKLAWKIAKKSFAGIEFEDLRQEGFLALLQEKEKYDDTKNDNFLGFVYKRVWGAMLDFVSKSSVYKYRTVRKKYKRDDIKLVSAPENVEDYHIDFMFDDEQIDRIEREKVESLFEAYLLELTSLEQRILFDYFVLGHTMKGIGEVYKVQRTKVRKIILACIFYMKERLKQDLESVSFASLSVTDGSKDSHLLTDYKYSKKLLEVVYGEVVPTRV